MRNSLIQWCQKISKIISKNKNHDINEFDFLISREGMKKGPVSNMLDTFKTEFENRLQNEILHPKDEYKKHGGQLWKNKLGKDVEKTKAMLEYQQRQK